MVAASSERDEERNDEAAPLLPGKGAKARYCSVPDPEAFFSGLPSKQQDDFLIGWPPKSRPFLDVTRICCVWCVAVDHGNSDFGIWNVMFTQAWVLQYLFLVCGVCYGMSKKAVWAYEGRLFIYVVVGVLINGFGFWLSGTEDIGLFNVIFQFWFVVGLMAYTLLLAPLRFIGPWLRSRDVLALTGQQEQQQQPSEQGGARTLLTEQQGDEAAGRQPQAKQLAHHPAAPSAAGSTEDTDVPPAGQRFLSATDPVPGWQRALLLRILLILLGGLFMLGLLFKVLLSPALLELSKSIWKVTDFFGGGESWGWPTNELEARKFLENQSTYFLASLGNIYLFLACPFIFEQKSLTTWAIFFNNLLQRCAFYRNDDERMFHGLDLMLLAMSSFYMGITHRRVLGEYAIRYWFVVIFVCSMLWPPGAHTRFDEHPPQPEDVATRVRLQLMEGIIILFWLVAADRLFQDEIFTEDGLDFLNWWALVIFLVHKAVHVAVPPPLNWALLVALAPAVYVVLRLWRNGGRW